jgi:hypothetical protein
MTRRSALLLGLLGTACAAAAKRTDHADGFSLTHPDGWMVESSGGRIRASAADRSEWIGIEAAPLAGARDAAAVLRELAAGGRLAGLRAPRVVAARGGGAEAEMLLAVPGPAGTLRVHALLALRGGVGTLYLAAAPEPRFRERAPELVRILESFTLRGGADIRRYERVREPREDAYSLELPAGWRSSLGVYRSGALPPRTETLAASPDGAITLFLGVRDGGVFTGPDAQLASLGIREGAIYNPSGIHPMPVLRYLPGDQYAAHWLRSRLPGARPVQRGPRPDFAQRLAELRYRFGNATNAQIHAGELEFAHQERSGRLLAATEVYPAGAGFQWQVPFFAGYAAAPGREGEAAALLAHAVDSSRLNLEWLRRDRAFRDLDHARAMETMSATNRMFRETMAERAASSARNARGIGDTLSGTYRVLDPTTNEYTTVQAGSNFYYRVNRTNAVYGTDLEESRVDVTRMLRIDWDR